MKIKVEISRDELNEIIAEQGNYVGSCNDLRINIIDAIDGTLSLPGYDVEVNVID
ncbi:MAG: hypothetical protein ACRDBQ_11905 [Shewanella sp.]